jgi:PleD family two-component response regulator
MNSNATSTPTRKALVVDTDKDRYRRKERIVLIQNAGFKAYPVLRLQDACVRCKPGSFDLVAVNATENGAQAVELCDQMKKNDPNLQLFLVSSSPDTPSRDYVVSDWAEVIRRIGNQAKAKTESVSQNTLQVA